MKRKRQRIFILLSDHPVTMNKKKILKHFKCIVFFLHSANLAARDVATKKKLLCKHSDFHSNKFNRLKNRVKTEFHAIESLAYATGNTVEMIYATFFFLSIDSMNRKREKKRFHEELINILNDSSKYFRLKPIIAS